MNEQGEGRDRRQALRMADRILFFFDRVEPKKYETLRRDFARGIPPYQQEELQDVRFQIRASNALARLRSRDEDLADFLQHLDAKINLLMKEVHSGRSPLNRLTPEDVSLSSGGIAFFTDRNLPVGEHLELHLVLEPNRIYIYCTGEVVGCDQKGRGNKPYRVSVKFTLLAEEDREQLIQHLFKLQSKALRKRRQQV
jgi:hypothetical protein